MATSTKKRNIIITIFSLFVLPLILSIPSWYNFMFNSKELSYNVIARPLVSDIGDNSNKLEFVIGNNKVKSPFITEVNVENTGDDPISSKDFDGHLTLTTKGEAKILDHQIINKKPSDIRTESKIDGNNILLSPMLLNAGDKFTFQIISDGTFEDVALSARISGISQLSQMEINGKSWTSLAFNLFILFVYGFGYCVFMAIPKQRDGIYSALLSTKQMAAITLTIIIGMASLLSHIYKYFEGSFAAGLAILVATIILSGIFSYLFGLFSRIKLEN